MRAMTKVDGLMKSVLEVFDWIQKMDLRVGSIWRPPREVAVLEEGGTPFFDRVNDPRVRDAYLETVGSPYVGILFGALVFSSEVVVPGHGAILPHGFEARLVEGTACIALGLHRWA